MEFENQLEKDIVQQKEDMIKRLAFETAKRLNGIKPVSYTHLTLPTILLV